jgi:hypothetical protein
MMNILGLKLKQPLPFTHIARGKGLEAFRLPVKELYFSFHSIGEVV